MFVCVCGYVSLSLYTHSVFIYILNALNACVVVHGECVCLSVIFS